MKLLSRDIPLLIFAAIVGVLMRPLMEQMPWIGDWLRENSEIIWEHESSTVILDEKLISNSGIRIDGEDVQGLYVQTVKIRNTGNKALENLKVDYDLTAIKSGLEILGKPRHNFVDPNRRLQYVARENPRTLSQTYEFELFNPGAEIHTSILTNLDASVSLRVDAPYLKVQTRREVEEREQWWSDLRQTIKMIITGLFFVIVIIVWIYKLISADDDADINEDANIIRDMGNAEGKSNSLS